MVTTDTVDEVRDIVQKIIIPIVFVIGLIGNSITVIVLTRKSMRCSTNIYLTALAITDMLYLTTAFLLTFQHYISFHLYHPLYWRCFGLLIWFHDGLSYISIYIATCFTIERFIAVRYPIRRQQFCTEELAKKVVIALAIFCMGFTISTAFEHSVSVKKTNFDPVTNTFCKTKGQNISDSNPGSNFTAHDDVSVGRALLEGDEFLNNMEMSSAENDANVTCLDYYSKEASDLGMNSQYEAIFFHFTMIVFVVIPLIILITFNTFLIILVRKSRTLRTEMTKMSIRNTKKASSKSLTAAKTSKVSQENKITIVLIAVVILFIICQLPWSTYLIVSYYIEIENNLRLLLGNVFNLLVDINSATNFFLYCVLSDKYRKTVKDIVMGIRQKRQDTLSELTRQGTLTTSWYRHSSKYTFAKPNSIRKNLTSDVSLPTLLNRQSNSENSNQRIEHIPFCEKDNRKHNITFPSSRNESNRLSLNSSTHPKYNTNCPYHKCSNNNNNNNNNNSRIWDRPLVDEHHKDNQRRRSLSLTMLPRTKHAPCCKNFPDDL